MGVYFIFVGKDVQDASPRVGVDKMWPLSFHETNQKCHAAHF